MANSPCSCAIWLPPPLLGSGPCGGRPPVRLRIGGGALRYETAGDIGDSRSVGEKGEKDSLAGDILEKPAMSFSFVSRSFMSNNYISGVMQLDSQPG